MSRSCLTFLLFLATALTGISDNHAAEPGKPLFDRNWIARSTTAMGVTGDARLMPDRITFDGHATFKLRFIAEMAPKKPSLGQLDVDSYSLYEIVDPKPQAIHNGNHLCGHPKYTRNVPLARYMAIGLSDNDLLDILVYARDTPPEDINYSVQGACGGYNYFTE